MVILLKKCLWEVLSIQLSTVGKRIRINVKYEWFEEQQNDPYRFVRLVQDSSLRCFVLPIILYSERLDCYYYLVDSVNIRTTTDVRNLFCLHTSNVWYYDGKRWEQKKNGEREREREIKRNNSQKQNPTKDWLVTLFVNVYRCLLLLCRHWWMLYYNLWYCITMQKLLILSATS